MRTVKHTRPSMAGRYGRATVSSRVLNLERVIEASEDAEELLAAASSMAFLCALDNVINDDTNPSILWIKNSLDGFA